jgi:Family of unknown function (DUF6191)
VIVWLVSLPALVVGLFVLAVVDQVMLWVGKAGVLPWRPKERDRRVSATGFEQLHGQFSPGKVQELKQRQSVLMMRDDETQGAPPRSEVNLIDGTAVIRVPRPPS